MVKYASNVPLTDDQQAIQIDIRNAPAQTVEVDLEGLEIQTTISSASIAAGVEAATNLNLAKNTGNVDANTLRMILADNAALYTLLGAIDDAASATGSLNAKLRQIAANLDLTKNAGNVDANTLRMILASDAALYTLLGAVDDAASATGSLNAKLRQIATNLGTKGAGA